MCHLDYKALTLFAAFKNHARQDAKINCLPFTWPVIFQKIIAVAVNNIDFKVHVRFFNFKYYFLVYILFHSNNTTLRPKCSDFFTLPQTKLLKNHTPPMQQDLHTLCSSNMLPPSYPFPINTGSDNDFLKLTKHDHHENKNLQGLKLIKARHHHLCENPFILSSGKLFVQHNLLPSIRSLEAR